MAPARLRLEGVKFSGEISGQKMVAYGRSEGEDSDGGGIDGRLCLNRENRRFEASVADDSVVVRKLQTTGNGRSEERERIAGERRERL